jgi:hypothetical protein
MPNAGGILLFIFRCTVRVSRDGKLVPIQFLNMSFHRGPGAAHVIKANLPSVIHRYASINATTEHGTWKVL